MKWCELLHKQEDNSPFAAQLVSGDGSIKKDHCPCTPDSTRDLHLS